MLKKDFYLFGSPKNVYFQPKDFEKVFQKLLNKFFCLGKYVPQSANFSVRSICLLGFCYQFPTILHIFSANFLLFCLVPQWASPIPMERDYCQHKTTYPRPSNNSPMGYYSDTALKPRGGGVIWAVWIFASENGPPAERPSK